MTEEVYIDVIKASRLTGIKVQTLYSLARQGKCPAIKVPDAEILLFPKARLIEWLESGSLEGKGRPRVSRKTKD